MRDQLDADAEVQVTAVVTAFNPDQHLVLACQSLRGQVDAVVVVDDASTEGAAALDDCRALGATILRHASNLGVGAALNTGVAAARGGPLGGAAHSYVLTLDQDSVLPPGYVDALLAAGREAARHGLDVAMVGPEQAGGTCSGTIHTDGHVLLSREPIQSGLLIPCTTFDGLGVFADELFIDGVDTEFYLRATTRGRVAVVAPGVRLEHRLGSQHVVSLHGHRVALTHAASFRYYYIARNRVLLLRRYQRAAPTWALGAIWRDIRHLAIATALVPDRRSRLRNTAAGLRDGIRGVTGRRPGGH